MSSFPSNPTNNFPLPNPANGSPSPAAPTPNGIIEYPTPVPVGAPENFLDTNLDAPLWTRNGPIPAPYNWSEPYNPAALGVTPSGLGPAPDRF